MIDKKYQRKKDVNSLIQSREWVEDGMKLLYLLFLHRLGMDGLLRMIKDSFNYFDALVCLSCYQPLSCHQYSWCLGYVLSTLWVLNVNARVGCIERMTMADIQQIEVQRCYLASDFKTSSTYGYQIVNTNDIIKIFIKYVRRHVIPQEIDSPGAVAFPCYKGTPLSQGYGTHSHS